MYGIAVCWIIVCYIIWYCIIVNYILVYCIIVY